MASPVGLGGENHYAGPIGRRVQAGGQELLHGGAMHAVAFQRGGGKPAAHRGNGHDGGRDGEQDDLDDRIGFQGVGDQRIHDADLAGHPVRACAQHPPGPPAREQRQRRDQQRHRRRPR
jgi:hypothetical protein